MPELSIITTCKGRLAFLKRSLPAMAAQAGAEVIVVDYDCPEGAGDWVAATFPAVRLVRIEDAPTFHISRARNLGAQAARGRWLCFVDADIVLNAEFAARALPALRGGAFYVLTNDSSPAQGTFICAREDFAALGGYDEVMRGYGMEDNDIYIRLQMLGRAREILAAGPVTAIDHPSDLRTQHHEIKDRWLNRQINALYVQVKHDLVRHYGTRLNPRVLAAVYEQIRGAFASQAASGAPEVRLEVTLAPDGIVGFRDRQLRRVWVYTLGPAPAVRISGPITEKLSDQPGQEK